MGVKILVTGGTFDKEYNELNGQLYFKETHIDEILSLGRSAVQVDVQTVLMIDSMEMTDTHRSKIVESINASSEKKIVITHGTDTMVDTAAYIHKKNTDKTVVLTGALIPYKFGSSDGLFNLGAALAFVQVLPSGVYIAMHGKCFDWNAVKKNKTTGQFISL